MELVVAVGFDSEEDLGKQVLDQEGYAKTESRIVPRRTRYKIPRHLRSPTVYRLLFPGLRSPFIVT